MAGLFQLRATPQTLQSRVNDGLAGLFGHFTDERHARRLSNKATGLLDAVTPAGNLFMAQDGVQQARRGGLGNALMGAGQVALAALPAAPRAKAALKGLDLSRGFHVFKEGPATLEITSDGARYARLNMIKTDPKARGQGAAKAALEKLTTAADAAGITLDLNPEAMDAATSVKRLREFYAKHGFVPNKGRNKDFYTQAEMIRPPKR